MDYLRVGRAIDIENPREKFIFRLLEIFPGAFSWLTLFGVFFLSWRQPFIVSYFLIFFVIFWLARGIYFSFHLESGFRRMQKNRKTDWLEKLDKLSPRDYSLALGSWRDIYHLVLLPNYKEPAEIIRESLNSLLLSDYPKEKLIVVVSFEERAGPERKLVAEGIRQEFEGKFFKLLTTFHPANLVGEIAGHGSNDHWAASQAKELIIDPLGIPYENIIVSSFDVDTLAFPRYFSCLTFYYLTCQNPTRKSFQPIPLYNNNFWDAPAISQISSFTSTFWQIMCQERPENLVSFSSHAISFKALVGVGFKQTNIIPDDSRIFWQCFFRYDGDYEVVPIFYPVSMDSNVGRNWWTTLKQIYKQKKRWAYGVEDIPYFLYGCLKNKKVPLKKKLSRGLELISGHWSWATASILIFSLGWLPLFLGGPIFSRSLLAYSVPKMASRVMTFAMIGMITSVWYSSALLPERREGKGKMRYLVFVAAWILVPLDMLIFGSIPALESQTRCMLGKYLSYWATPKQR
jgi:cellulose synthase/poly-beta-1,6-N-acetylglucosamine synthase-like glycosyltransferase